MTRQPMPALPAGGARIAAGDLAELSLAQFSEIVVTPASRREENLLRAGSVAMARRIFTALFALLCLAAGTAACQPVAGQDLERSVKAAFLYQFVGYAEWPASAFPAADAPFVIATLAADRIAEELERMVRGRRVGNRGVAVRRLKDGESFAGVHLLFIGQMDKARLAATIKAAQQRPILVVTENEGALALGSAINFLLADGKVRFEASTAAAEKAGIKLSSRMLALAFKLRTGAQ